jgi:hypothetical protein
MTIIKKQREHSKCWWLVRMWRNFNHCALLVGMQNVAATVENNKVVKQFLKENRI